MRRARSALGITVKSGWASVVLLVGPPTLPRVADSRRIELSDPATPESRQPYHVGFGTARSVGRELSRLVGSVKQFGRQSVTGAIRDYQTIDKQVRGLGVVVGSLTDPGTIANDHIRIHALEGQLFRGVVEDAAAENRLRCSVWRERDLYALAAGILNRSKPELRATVTAFGHDVEGPWRAEQKAAALAAWVVLAKGTATKEKARS